jgi:hypothetical protein
MILLTGAAGVVQVTDEGGHRLRSAAATAEMQAAGGRPGGLLAGIPGLLS